MRIGGRTVFMRNMYQSGVTMINDLTRADGGIMTLGELKAVFPTLNPRPAGGAESAPLLVFLK